MRAALKRYKRSAFVLTLPFARIMAKDAMEHMTDITMKTKLTKEQVATLIATEKAKGPKSEKECRETPCYNFLLTLPDHTKKWEDDANLKMDARLYRWKPSIVRVISKGINLAHSR